MEITNTKIRQIFNKKGCLKAIVSLTFDNIFALHDVKIIEGGGKLFIAMPSRRREVAGKITFCDVAHPTDNPFRIYLESIVISEYIRYTAATSESLAQDAERYAKEDLKNVG
ncbi:MAG: SpoVG family protein [Oscillospiraceae bacterium]|jgi:stage V sporulation protein G|nr:SpoVG family protein [Oscillospiraceae bacterium]